MRLGDNGKEKPLTVKTSGRTRPHNHLLTPELEIDYTRNYWEDEDDIYQEFEELDFETLPDRSDTQSIASDDSFYPLDNSVTSHMRYSFSSDSPEPISFFKACCNNNAVIVKIMIRQGVTEEEVKETDRNRRSGLIVACYNGYVDVVIALSQCPYLDVNWQDNEGNTALITAAQAGNTPPQAFESNPTTVHTCTHVLKTEQPWLTSCIHTLYGSNTHK
uniref:Ankyrin repeat domain 33B n=1 Tax=Maylandia zebra TaxID=106582 RepID=A0A3P9CBH4_9CICH